MESQTIYAFIDSQNVNLAIRDQGWKLDFGRFRIYLNDKYRVKKAFLFIGYVKKNENLYTELRSQGYILIFKPTLLYNKKAIKGNVDAELVLRAMIEFPNYDQAIIVTGDGDFHCLVEYLKKKRKLARLLIPNQKKYSALLRKFSKHIDFMDALRKKLANKKEGHYPSDETLGVSPHRDKKSITRKTIAVKKSQ